MTSSGLTTLFQTIFYGLSDETLDTLRKVAETRQYAPNTVLVRQGEPGDAFYVVIEGKVIITQRQDDGEEVVLGICGPGKYFGEMALLDNTPRAATCTTMVPTTVLEITAAAFSELAQSSPAIAHSLTNTILRNLRENDGRAIKMLMAKNEELARAYNELQAAQLELIKHERLKRELEIAAEVQRSLLPDALPAFDDYDFAAYLQFAQRAGGNFYDVIALDDAHVGVLLGDIADKGIHAALFMAVTRTLFLMESKRTLSPAEVLERVNQAMGEVSTRNDIFVKAFYGVLHRPTGRLSYVIAGQSRPLLGRANGKNEILQGGGRLLGMLENVSFEEQEVTLQSGDRLLLFSDGIAAAVNLAGRQYDVARLQRIVRARPHLSAQELIDTIAEDLSAWGRNATPAEDVALLAVVAR